MTRDIRKFLHQLRHDDKEEFLRLIAEMVNLLVDPEFADIAAKYSSWPINVPVLKAPKRSKKAEGTLSRFFRDTREGQCAFILDEWLKVGSALSIKLRGRKSINTRHEISSLAKEALDDMDAVRNFRRFQNNEGRGCGTVPSPTRVWRSEPKGGSPG